MSGIMFKEISNYVLNRVSLEIADRELLVMVGPSGAGKTTLLNVVAGLAPYIGSVLFYGTPVDRLPAQRRRVGYVFQDKLIFPHLTVKQNLMLALKPTKKNLKENLSRTEELLSLFRIESLRNRYPDKLSGGEKQRVALARAVACKPEILLLDEPFSGLDFRTSRYLRQEFKKQQKKLGVTTLFVTHDLAEARELADRIAVINEGKIESVGKTEDVMHAPMTHGQGFLEKPNVLTCKSCVSLDNGLVEVQWAGIKLLIPDEGRPVNRVAILPYDVYISGCRAPGPPINRFEGVITDISIAGESVHVLLKVDSESLRVEMALQHFDALNVRQGQTVHGILKLRSLWAM